MNHFWHGFEKRANESGSLTGGSGFSGAGKGNPYGSLERDRMEGAESAMGSAVGGDDTRTDKTLLDRERGPRTDNPFTIGPEFQDDSIPHLKY